MARLNGDMKPTTIKRLDEIMAQIEIIRGQLQDMCQQSDVDEKAARFMEVAAERLSDAMIEIEDCKMYDYYKYK